MGKPTVPPPQPAERAMLRPGLAKATRPRPQLNMPGQRPR